MTPFGWWFRAAAHGQDGDAQPLRADPALHWPPAYSQALSEDIGAQLRAAAPPALGFRNGPIAVSAAFAIEID